MNKILESPLRAEIDKLILAGKSVYEVESWCRDNGLAVSATSLKRYAEQYLPDWQSNKSVVKQETVKSESKETKTTKSYKVDLTDKEISTQFNQIISDNLKESIVNMATLVTLKISEYCSGESTLPKDDIAMLEKFIGMFNTITSKLNETRAGDNLFDIDTALCQAVKKTGDDVPSLDEYLKNLASESEEVSYE